VAHVAVAQPFDFDQHGVVVAVHENVHDFELVARRVSASATSFMKPTIRTSDVSASWMTAGISPSSFE